MINVYDRKNFKIFGKGAFNPHGLEKIKTAFSENAVPRLALLEEKFFAAKLCLNRLKNRSERYGKLKFNSEILANQKLRQLHADEYFFFTCCGFIYKEILLLRKRHLLADLPVNLLEGLKTLNDERRHHEHGKEWYWGEIQKNNPPIPSKGDNFDFDQNLKLLSQIYDCLVSKLETVKTI